MYSMASGHVLAMCHFLSECELICMCVYKKLGYVICVALSPGLPPFFHDIKAHLQYCT